MYKLILLLAFICFVSSTNISADSHVSSTEKIALAEEVLGKDSLKKFRESYESLRVIADKLSPERKASYLQLFEKVFPKPEDIRRRLVESYAARLSVEELTELKKYAANPVVKSALEKQDRIIEEELYRLMEMGQVMLGEVTAEAKRPSVVKRERPS